MLDTLGNLPLFFSYRCRAAISSIENRHDCGGGRKQLAMSRAALEEDDAFIFLLPCPVRIVNKCRAFGGGSPTCPGGCMDVLFVTPDSSNKAYQDLARTFS